MSAPTSAKIIDGVALSTQLRADVARRTTALKAQGITPGLAVVLVGDSPASQVYVRNKIKACADAFKDLPPATYKIAIKDNNGCVKKCN